jgi:hypothetical protein
LFGLSATSQQYFSLGKNQSPAINQQYFYLRTNQHQAPAISHQSNKQVATLALTELRYLLCWFTGTATSLCVR